MKRKSVLILVLTFMFSFTSIAYASSVKRLSGETRYDTAASIAQDGWKQSDYALLAYGENFPDALCAAPLAKKYDAPMLLTTGNSLPTVTKETLISLQVKSVLIIGGTAVIPASIDTELQSMKIRVTRIAGLDRYDTAIKVAQQLPSPTEVIVVTGEDYPDALSVGPIAALKQQPIILMPKDYMPDSVKAYFSSTTISKSYVVGNSDIISAPVFHQIPGSERIEGSDSYERNINVNLRFKDLFTTKAICLATGEGFADASTGAAYAAKKEMPLVLVNNSPASFTRTYTLDKLNTADGINGTTYVFGGTVVVPERVVSDLSTLPIHESNKPSPPTNLVVTAISSSQITIQWNQSVDVDYYHIYYNEDDPNSSLYSFIDGDGSQLQCQWFPENSAQLTSLEPNTTVYFKVTSVKNGIESAYSNVAKATTFKAFEPMISTQTTRISDITDTPDVIE